MKKWLPKDIKKLRKKYKLSQQKLAGFLGVTALYISFLERGSKVPSKTLQILLGFTEEKLKKGDSIKYGKTKRHL